MEPGPTSYNTLNSKKINSKGTVWTKDKVKRFIDRPNVDIGPGKYDTEVHPHKNAVELSPIFKSGTVRTFFDTILYNSNSEYVVEQRKQRKFKSVNPAPGQYNLNDSSFNIVA